jgi:hypothetical protein
MKRTIGPGQLDRLTSASVLPREIPASSFHPADEVPFQLPIIYQIGAVFSVPKYQLSFLLGAE